MSPNVYLTEESKARGEKKSLSTVTSMGNRSNILVMIDGGWAILWDSGLVLIAVSREYISFICAALVGADLTCRFMDLFSFCFFRVQQQCQRYTLENLPHWKWAVTGCSDYQHTNDILQQNANHVVSSSTSPCKRETLSDSAEQGTKRRRGRVEL